MRKIYPILLAVAVCAAVLYYHGNAIFRYVLAEPPVPTEEHIAALEPHLEIMKPERTDGPLPVAVILPGCLHTDSHNNDWHTVFLELGYAVVIVDSFRSRGIPEDSFERVCLGFTARGFDRAGDIYATVAYLKRQEWADGDRIVLAGWSHGGWAVMDAMSLYAAGKTPRNLPDAEQIDGVSGILLVYPYCGFGTAAHTGFVWDKPVPTLLYIAGSDRSMDPEQCTAWYDGQDSPYLYLVVEPDAEHTFDIPAPKNRNPVRFSEEYLRNAMHTVRTFFALSR